MGYDVVYSSLRKLFPQVDFRVLKAVAFEHREDADAAVEFVLSEVYPRMNKPWEEADFRPGSQEVGHLSFQAVELEKLDQALDHSVPPSEAHVDLRLDHPVPPAKTHIDLPLLHSVLSTEACVDPLSELRCPKGEASSLSVAHAGCHVESKTCSVSCADGDFHEDQMCVKSDEEIVSLEKHRNPGSCKDASAGSIIDEHSAVTDGQNLHEQTVDDDKDPCALSSRNQPLDSSIEENLLPAVQQITSPVEETIMIPVVATLEGAIRAGVVNNCEESRSKDWKEDMEESIFDAEMIQVGNRSLTTSHSDQIICVDLLEEFITEAKEYKKILSLEIEPLMNIAREVELQEIAANEAKIEASKVGLDIFAKVDELKEMLQHAKQANDMHAGEVSGERSILATEARELQSRLLSLSDKREKSLLLINEIRENLNARLAEAEAVKAMAEQEKLQKEESARKALAKQELLMDMVVQESKRIQQEAEENAKLQDFLVDRGRVVDMLQGEIAVICEDVKMLKERVESRLPISKSLSMSQIGGALTSSHTSYKSTSSDRAPELSKSSESLAKSSRDLSSSGHSVGSNSSRKDINGGMRSASIEEEWDLFEEYKSSQWNVISGDGISA